MQHRPEAGGGRQALSAVRDVLRSQTVSAAHM